jgi:cytochrome o ubiquinol oxidase subunit 2
MYQYVLKKLKIAVRARYLQAAGLLALPLLGGCTDLRLLDSGGPIGAADRDVILAAFGLMLIVMVPVIVMSLAIPWHYRATNTKATYNPDWKDSNRIETIVWLVPALVVTALAVLVWIATHRLDPYKPIASGQDPVQVEAVSMDWKWLFIYPRLGIATVNQLVFPAKTPLSLHITSDSVMTSFFVPRLGSQIYAMAGMQTRLNLLADKPGKYLGENTQYSGAGFSGMHFDAVAMTRDDFDHWVAKVRRSRLVLDRTQLARLEQPKAWVPVEHYARVTPHLFESIIHRYRPAMSSNAATATPAQATGSGRRSQPVAPPAWQDIDLREGS